MTTVLDEINLVNGWIDVPFRAVAHKVSDSGHPQLEPLSVFLDDGVVPRSSREDNHNELGASLEKYQRVIPNDLVFNKLRTWQGGFGVSRYEGIVSPAYIIARPNLSLIEPRFLGYLLKSSPYLTELKRLSKWMPPTQFDISWESIRDLKLRIPSVDEQSRIADFLDEQVGTITQLVLSKKSQIVKVETYLLEETERLIFTPGVLCTPSRIMNSSELADPFEHNLPENWHRTKFRYIAAADSVPSGGLGNLLSVYLREGVIPFAQGGEDRVHNPSEDMSRYQKVEFGHLVMNNQQAWRGSVGVSSLEGIISPAYHIYRLSDELEPRFANMLFRSRPLVFLYEQVSRGVGNIQRNLDGSSLKNIPVVYPDIHTQANIIQSVEELSESVNKILQNLYRSISVLEELKSSIITRSTTGTLDTAKGRS
jgi:type I restriction enzyme S subunit